MKIHHKSELVRYSLNRDAFLELHFAISVKHLTQLYIALVLVGLPICPKSISDTHLFTNNHTAEKEAL